MISPKEVKRPIHNYLIPPDFIAFLRQQEVLQRFEWWRICAETLSRKRLGRGTFSVTSDRSNLQPGKLRLISVHTHGAKYDAERMLSRVAPYTHRKMVVYVRPRNEIAIDCSCGVCSSL